jgi:hypothetical protein
LLGSIVDVRITGSSRWCTFATIESWVFRCPEPPPEPSKSALLRARARVRAVQQQHAQMQVTNAVDASISTPERTVRPERESEGGATTLPRDSGGLSPPHEVILRGNGETIGAHVAKAETHNVQGEIQVDRKEIGNVDSAKSAKSTCFSWELSQRVCSVEALLAGGVVVGVCGLVVAGALSWRYRH